MGKKAHRIAHAMQADIIRRIKEECETPSHAHQIKGNGLAYTIAPL
jgi:Mn-dependent DtxR family transcriptional regulator